MKPMARWPLVLFVVALFAVLALPREARAGSLQIRDEAHVLAPEDAARLRSTVATARFDARLVFTNDYAEAGDLSLMVASLLTKPDTIAVGVDPRHRHVQVHFGTGSGIPRAAWPAIERAGNGAFRNGEWEAGAAAILGAAADATTGASEQAAPVAPRSPNFVGSGLFLLLGIAAIIGVTAFFFARRRSPYDASGGGYGPTPPLGAGGYGPAPYAGPGYPAPPVGGGMGPLGGGLIGAGLGGLAGYELGKLEGEREERDREIRPLEGQSVGRDDDYDAGGGGSGWGDAGGGSDGGGDDGGFDGGGFDGGGGDSGGGSDF